MDGDGKRDYALLSGGGAAGNPWLVTVFAGTTGSVIRQWAGTGFAYVAFAADVDVDGCGDVLIATVWGTAKAMSGRDGDVLFEMPPPQDSFGIPPGSSFPVLLASFSTVALGYSTALLGTTTSGNGCSSVGSVPAIAVRPVGATHVRVQTGSAPPASLAWCAIDAAGSVPQPVALDPLGLVGCAQHVGLGAVLAGIVGATGIDRGYCAFDLPRVLDATGVAFEAQWLFLDPPTGGYATTRRLEFRVR
jgi:hypothetical protein